jgi:hypothetical protein
MSEFRRLDAGLSPWSFRFNSDDCIHFVVDEVPPEKVSLQVSLVFPCYSSFHHCSIFMYHHPNHAANYHILSL